MVFSLDALDAARLTYLRTLGRCAARCDREALPRLRSRWRTPRVRFFFRGKIPCMPTAHCECLNARPIRPLRPRPFGRQHLHPGARRSRARGGAGRAGRTFAEEEVTSIVDALSSSVNMIPVCVSACTDRSHPFFLGARILRPIGRTIREPSLSGRLMWSAAWEDCLRRGNPHHRV